MFFIENHVLQRLLRGTNMPEELNMILIYIFFIILRSSKDQKFLVDSCSTFSGH